MLFCFQSYQVTLWVNHNIPLDVAIISSTARHKIKQNNTENAVLRLSIFGNHATQRAKLYLDGFTVFLCNAM